MGALITYNIITNKYVLMYLCIICINFCDRNIAIVNFKNYTNNTTNKTTKTVQ